MITVGAEYVTQFLPRVLNCRSGWNHIVKGVPGQYSVFTALQMDSINHLLYDITKNVKSKKI